MDLPILQEIKEEYRKLRGDGKTRSEATEFLLESYSNELADFDDAPIIWIGLADAQYACKELTEEVSEQALSALKKVEKYLTPKQFSKRMESYQKAPMPEQNIRQKKYYHTPWAIGDVFAYQLTHEAFDQFNIRNYYMLLQVIDIEPFDGRTLPLVTLTVWPSTNLPENLSAHQDLPLLKLFQMPFGENAGRYRYRMLLLFTSTRSVNALTLKYLGNHPLHSIPDDIIINDNWYILASPKDFWKNCFYGYRRNQYYTTGIKPTAIIE